MPIGHIHAPHGVGHQGQPVGALHLERQTQQFIRQMPAIGNDFCCECIEAQRGLHQPAAHGVGLLQPQPSTVRHGAEQVIHMACPPANGAFHLIERSVRMAQIQSHTLALTGDGKTLST